MERLLADGFYWGPRQIFMWASLEGASGISDEGFSFGITEQVLTFCQANANSCT
ncbi:MAG: hypothetical protein R2769_16880 [Saprospiraceae bacterium]